MDKELVFCLNGGCEKRHCLCHPSGRHWRSADRRMSCRHGHFGGETPCEGYVPRYERHKYNIDY